MSLHKEAHAKCFIANSVNFPVRHEPARAVGASTLCGAGLYTCAHERARA
jgi:hypothetical protein